MNTPNLRFPEFKGNWDVNKLGKIMEFKKGSSLSKADLTNVGEPCILYGELYTKYGAVINKVMSRTNRLLSSPVIGKKNDVLIPSSGESAIDIACASTIDTNENVILGGDLNVLTPHGGINGKFISYQINGVRKAKLSKFAQGASVVHLYNDSLKKFEILLPTMEEQEKIANFFTLLDRRIEKQQEKVEALRDYKKGMLQKIFSRELRFKDENGEEFPEWEHKKFHELGDFKKSYSYSRSVEGEGKYRHLHYGDIHSKYEGILVNTIFPTINVEGDYEIIENGDLIFADASEDYKDLGKCVVVWDVGNEKVIAGLHTHRFSVKSFVDSRFIMYFTKTRMYEAFIRKVGTGISVLGISKKNLEILELQIPILQEQQKIADFLSKLDEKIEKEEAKLEALQEQKKSFMQQMFI